MEELYVVIGTDNNQYSWTCHDSMDEEVFENREAADSLRNYLNNAEELKSYNYVYRTAKLSFLD